LFLGAGASVPYGKPTTKELKEKLTNYSPSDLIDEIFQSFITHPKFLDIEYVLQSVREIVNFSKNKGGLYFFEHGKNGIFNYKHGHVPFDTFAKNVETVERVLENSIFEYYRWERDSNKSLLKIFDEVFYLLNEFSEEIHVFTTNYDKAVEQYCNLRHKKFVCIDGFERNPPHHEFAKWNGNFSPILAKQLTNIFLYKLHGSLNWKEHIDEGIVRTNEESKPDDHNFLKNVVIYPTLSPKIEEETEPHRTIINRFRSRMDESEVCIVIGYSFRDSLNVVFEKFVKNGKLLIIISPSAVDDFCKNMLGKNIDEKDQPRLDQPNIGLFTTKTTSGQVVKIFRILKKLNVDTVKEIMHDIRRKFEPEKHPF